jgi:bifunctional non-homologous end joining protein LigD
VIVSLAHRRGRLNAGASSGHPEPGISKVGIAQYYEIVEFILPHIARRPLSLLRSPEGVMGERFFQAHGGRPFQRHQAGPDHGHGWHRFLLMIEDAKGLLALVQMSVLEIHRWSSTVSHLEKPCRLIFDPNPDEDLGWHRVIAADFARDLLEKLGVQLARRA